RMPRARRGRHNRTPPGSVSPSFPLLPRRRPDTGACVLGRHHLVRDRQAPPDDEAGRWQTRPVAKVAIIGAGSVEFTRNIITDLSSAVELHGSLELALHDIDPERLAYAERAANQVVDRLGAGHRVSSHPDRKTAFDGADYLINE